MKKYWRFKGKTKVTTGRRMYKPDNALYTEGNKVFTRTYQSGDVDGRPTGKPIMVAEMVEE